jgi:hypothetical protein
VRVAGLAGPVCSSAWLEQYECALAPADQRSYRTAISMAATTSGGAVAAETDCGSTSSRSRTRNHGTFPMIRIASMIGVGSRLSIEGPWNRTSAFEVPNVPVADRRRGRQKN